MLVSLGDDEVIYDHQSIEIAISREVAHEIMLLVAQCCVLIGFTCRSTIQLAFLND